MNHHARLLVGLPVVGRSVLIYSKGGKLHIYAPIGAFINYFQGFGTGLTLNASRSNLS